MLSKQSDLCDVCYIAANSIEVLLSQYVKVVTARHCSTYGLARMSPVRLHMVDEVLPVTEAPVDAGVFTAAALRRVTAGHVYGAEA